MSEALNWYSTLDDDIEYKTEAKKIEFAVDISRRMKHLGMSKSDLATSVSTSNAYITKVLRGDSNLTIESLVKFADAVDGELHLHISPKEAEVKWLDVLINPPKPKEMNDAAIWARTSQGERHGIPYSA